MTDYRALVENAPVTVAFVDDGGRFLYVNAAFERFLGYTRQEIVGTSAFDLVHPDDHMTAVLSRQHTIQTSALEGSVPIRLRHKDSRWLQFDLDARAIPGDLPGIVITARLSRSNVGETSELQRISGILRSQQESSPDGILIAAGDSSTLSYNQRFLELWRLDAATVEAGYARRSDAIRPLLKDPDVITELVERIYKDPRGKFELKVELADGRTLEAHTSPLLSPDGQFYARIWYYRDITDRLKADQDLVASEERYRRLVELSPDGVVVHQSGVLCYINTTGARLIGRPAAELIGTNVFSLISPEDIARVRDAAMAADFQMPEFIEIGMRTFQGEELTLEIASAASTFNGRPATQSVFRDISDRRRAEQAMHESEERYRSLVESSPDPVFVHDGLEVIYANPAAAEFLGFVQAADLTGSEAFELLGGVSRTEWLERVNRVLAGETLRISERSFLVYAGREAELDLAMSPATFAGRHCVQVLIRDLTAFRRAEHDRLALERKIYEAQKLESLGILAGGVAHDFNNLLVAIMGNAGLATMELTSNPTAAASYLKEVETAAQRAADLARQMLAYSGKGTFVIAPVDLVELVTEMTSLLTASMSHKVSLEYRLPAGLPAVNGDPTQLRQIVMNLVINAAEAIADRPGTIRVEAGEITATSEYLAGIAPGGGAAQPGNFVYFDVIDDGAGMDPATLSRVFEPFFSTKFTGRGLGLAAVLGIVQAHRGAMSVRSAPGRGTTFRILLPASPSRVETVPPSPPESKPPTATGRILVVDDEASVRSVGQAMLKRLGFEATAVSSGEEALETFASHQRDLSLILMDMTMPGMAGDEVARAIREMGSDIPIILMSGYSQQDAAARTGHLAIAGFLQKPFTLTDLKAAIYDALSGPS